MLDVVDDFQRQGRKEALAQEEHQPLPTPQDREGRREQGRNAVPPDQLVMNAEILFALTFQIFFLQTPGILEVAHESLGQEIVEALVVTTGRGVIRSGNMHMVTANMLYLETGVGHGGQQQATHPVFYLGVLVNQLMAQVDGNDATHGTDGNDPADLAQQAIVIGHEDVACVEQHSDPHKPHGNGGHPVEDFFAHGGHLHRFIGIGGVFADQEIQNRDNPEDEDVHKPRPVVLGAAFNAHVGRERYQRHHQRPERQIAVFFHF